MWSPGFWKCDYVERNNDASTISREQLREVYASDSFEANLIA